MQAIYNRLDALYTTALIDTSDALVKAELTAVAQQIYALTCYLNGICAGGAINIFQPISRELISYALADTEYCVDGKSITVSRYDIDTIGKISNGWFGIGYDVYLAGSGKSWNELDDENTPWTMINGRELRWTMAESR